MACGSDNKVKIALVQGFLSSILVMFVLFYVRQYNINLFVEALIGSLIFVILANFVYLIFRQNK